MGARVGDADIDVFDLQGFICKDYVAAPSKHAMQRLSDPQLASSRPRTVRAA